jgi:hypothetical protein
MFFLSCVHPRSSVALFHFFESERHCFRALTAINARCQRVISSFAVDNSLREIMLRVFEYCFVGGAAR